MQLIGRLFKNREEENRFLARRKEEYYYEEGSYYIELPESIEQCFELQKKLGFGLIHYVDEMISYLVELDQRVISMGEEMEKMIEQMVPEVDPNDTYEVEMVSAYRRYLRHIYSSI